MESMISLLNDINRSAQNVQGVLRSMAHFPGASQNVYIFRLQALIDEIGENSMEAAQELAAQVDRNELKGSLHIVYKSMESGDEMYTMLNRTIQPSMPESMRSSLESGMQILKLFLVRLAPEVVRIYGERDALFIITPGFQSLANNL